MKAVMKIVSQLGIGAGNNATAIAAKNNDRNKIALHYAQLNLSISFLFFLQCLIAF